MHQRVMERSECLQMLREAEDRALGAGRIVGVGSDCIDVVAEIGAVTGTLQAVALAVVDRHVRTRMVVAAGDPRCDTDEQIVEMAQAVDRLFHV